MTSVAKSKTVAISAAILALLLAVSLIQNYISVGNTAEYVFSAFEGNAYAVSRDEFIVAGQEGVTLFTDGERKSLCTVCLEKPVICSENSSFAVYEPGKERLYIIEKGELKTFDSTERIISAEISGGCYVLCTEKDGYKGCATVYDSELSESYEWRVSSGYVLSAALSDKGKRLAVLSVNSEGSTLQILDTESTEPIAEESFPGELGAAVSWISDRIVLLTDCAVHTMSEKGRETETFRFNEMHLASWSFSDNAVLVALQKHESGGKAQLLSLNENCRVLGRQETDNKLKSLDAQGKYFLVLSGDEALVYDKNLRVQGSKTSAGALKALLSDDRNIVFIYKCFARRI